MSKCYKHDISNTKLVNFTSNIDDRPDVPELELLPANDIFNVFNVEPTKYKTSQSKSINGGGKNYANIYSTKKHKSFPLHYCL